MFSNFAIDAEVPNRLICCGSRVNLQIIDQNANSESHSVLISRAFAIGYSLLGSHPQQALAQFEGSCSDK